MFHTLLYTPTHAHQGDVHCVDENGYGNDDENIGRSTNNQLPNKIQHTHIIALKTTVHQL